MDTGNGAENIAHMEQNSENCWIMRPRLSYYSISDVSNLCVRGFVKSLLLEGMVKPQKR